jgi:hypothetical protein
MDDIITQTGTIDTNLMNNITSLNNEIVSSSSSFSWKTIILYLILIVIAYFIITNLGRILSYLGYNTAEVAKQTISMSAEGSKSIIDVASNTITGSIQSLEKGLSLSGKNIRNNIDNKKVLVQETDNNQLEFNQMLNISKNRVKPKNEIDSTPVSRKNGFCYVGEDRGYRSCIKIGNADKCMSGDIFPSQEICINPALRG